MSVTPLAPRWCSTDMDFWISTGSDRNSKFLSLTGMPKSFGFFGKKRGWKRCCQIRLGGIVPPPPENTWADSPLALGDHRYHRSFLPSFRAQLFRASDRQDALKLVCNNCLLSELCAIMHHVRNCLYRASLCIVYIAVQLCSLFLFPSLLCSSSLVSIKMSPLQDN